jgi:hypothetical protein
MKNNKQLTIWAIIILIVLPYFNLFINISVLAFEEGIDKALDTYKHIYFPFLSDSRFYDFHLYFYSLQHLINLIIPDLTKMVGQNYCIFYFCLPLLSIHFGLFPINYGLLIRY